MAPHADTHRAVAGGVRVCVRADASTASGAGHVMRCLALAEALRDAGADVVFVSRRLPGDMTARVHARGFDQRILDGSRGPSAPEEVAETIAAFAGDAPSLVVADSYELTAAWEGAMRSRGIRVVAIDDGAQRAHDCDILFDQNLVPDDGADPYRGLIPEYARMLSGPRFALLRPEFAGLHDVAHPRDGVVRRVLVSFGGADVGNATGLTLLALDSLGDRGLRVDVVIGGSNPTGEDVERFALRSGATVHVDTDKMAEIMAEADLAVGAAGSTTWERCCLGLPTVAISVAPNQDGIAEGAARAGVLRFAGHLASVNAPGLATTIADVIDDPAGLNSMSVRGLALVDGRGARRAADSMLKGLRT